jgi:hypothetical protein
METSAQLYSGLVHHVLCILPTGSFFSPVKIISLYLISILCTYLWWYIHPELGYSWILILKFQSQGFFKELLPLFAILSNLKNYKNIKIMKSFDIQILSLFLYLIAFGLDIDMLNIDIIHNTYQ